MKELLLKLPENRRTGSKPRCHWLTHGNKAEVSRRLSGLIAPFGSVNATDFWMPDGFEDITEAQLHDAPKLVNEADGNKLRDWWLASTHGRPMTPNFDIASTCSVLIGNESRKGFLLVEAKAHTAELEVEKAGKKLDADASNGSHDNHQKIGECILEAAAGLSAATDVIWTMNRDAAYQMANRFAWAWKLTELGYPVILVYLGFIAADEMGGSGEDQPYRDHTHWAGCVHAHSKALFPEPDKIWENTIPVNGQTIVPIIRSMDIPDEDQCPEEIVVCSL